jgi:hypothetical protein
MGGGVDSFGCECRVKYSLSFTLAMGMLDVL